MADPRLAQFTDAHPDYDVRVIADPQIATFRHDGVDLAIRYGKPPFGKHLATHALFPLDVCAVCSPALLAAPASPRALAGHVLLHDAHDLWPEFLAAMPEPVDIDPHKGLRFNQTSLAIDAAVAGRASRLRPIRWSSATSPRADCASRSISHFRCRWGSISCIRPSAATTMRLS